MSEQSNVVKSIYVSEEYSPLGIISKECLEWSSYNFGGHNILQHLQHHMSAV